MPGPAAGAAAPGVNGGANAWDDFHRRWSGLRPPLRPDADVVAAIARHVADHDDRVLLLGATPELTGIGKRLVAVDWCEKAVARIWPGDDRRRRIVRADWRQMPLAPGSMSAAIGDGSLAVLPWGDVALAMDALAGALASGAPAAIRCYLAPAVAETIQTIVDDPERLAREGFHALKWRLAMAVSARTGPDVAVTAVRDAFEDAFPDRERLAATTGWSLATIAEIDAYRGSPVHFSFPTADALLGHIPPMFDEARFVPAGSYPLADRCPILVMRRR